MPQSPELVIERTLPAPPPEVWHLWTDPARLARWYGPTVETVIHRLEPRPGGEWLTEMRMDGGSMFQRADFTEVVPPRKLAFIQGNADADWTLADAPMPGWPRRLAGEVTLEDVAGETRMRFAWGPHEATEDEVATFAGMIDQMGKGWEMGFDIMADMLGAQER